MWKYVEQVCGSVSKYVEVCGSDSFDSFNDDDDDNDDDDHDSV